VALLEPPGFDLVRVAPDGAALVAGRAAPGASVTIYADAAPLAEVEADSQGNFVAIFRAEPSVSPQSLTLGAALPGDDEVASEEVVVLFPEVPVAAPVEAEQELAESGLPDGAAPPEIAAAPAQESEAIPEPTEAAEAEVSPEPVPAPEDAAIVETAALEAEVAPVPEVVEAGQAAEPEADPEAEAAPAPDVPEPAVAATAAPPQEEDPPAAPPRIAGTAIVRADGLEVTTTEAPQPRQVSLASISYADDGEVMLAGLGTAGARLRAYVDDGFAEEGTVGTDGRWALELGDVDVGVYRLRIDQIDGAGRVASRVETPFQRDLPRGPPARPYAGDRPMQVTVQPGSNLWTLARIHYGAGVLYSQIFLANQDLIRDPNLIYPGQIFDLPGVEDNR
jgi:nucleoid-associated protein YgaU